LKKKRKEAGGATHNELGWLMGGTWSFSGLLSMVPRIPDGENNQKVGGGEPEQGEKSRESNAATDPARRGNQGTQQKYLLPATPRSLVRVKSFSWDRAKKGQGVRTLLVNKPSVMTSN